MPRRLLTWHPSILSIFSYTLRSHLVTHPFQPVMPDLDGSFESIFVNIRQLVGRSRNSFASPAQGGREIDLYHLPEPLFVDRRGFGCRAVMTAVSTVPILEAFARYPDRNNTAQPSPAQQKNGSVPHL
jgi:hypothetical protein